MTTTRCRARRPISSSTTPRRRITARQPWPLSIDDDPKINNLARYECANDIERAHVFINRTGAIFLAHDFTVPWRATKFEAAKNFGSALKGLFLHIELIQPRRALKGYGRRNDFLAPDPGFSQAQYDSLALVYAVASRRAGFWLIPAFHSVLDEGIRNKHDDPQNFQLDSLRRKPRSSGRRIATRTAAADARPRPSRRTDPGRLPVGPAAFRLRNASSSSICCKVRPACIRSIRFSKSHTGSLAPPGEPGGHAPASCCKRLQIDHDALLFSVGRR